MSAETGESPEVTPKVDNRNVASNGAHVDQQVGVQLWDTTIHHDLRTYHINHGDPPERMHEVARNLLNGGTPRRAEEMFSALLQQGRITTERTYYYALSVMSERSLVDLSGRLLDNIKDAHKMCLSHPVDSWSQAFTVVWELLRRVKQEYAGKAAGNRLDVAGALGALPFARQEEIARHMDVVLRGLAEVWSQSDLATHMMRERTVPERTERSWKFFEAEPAEPKPYQPAPLRPVPGDRGRAFLGFTGLAIGLVFLVAGPFRVGLLPELALLCAGFHLVLRNGALIGVAALRHDAADRSATTAEGGDAESAEEHIHLSTGFGKNIGSLVDRLFKEHSGTAPEHEGEQPYQAYRTYLKRRLVQSYQPGEVKTANLRWLVTWHAKRAVARGRAGIENTAVSPSPFGTTARHRLGVVAVVAGVADALWALDVWAGLFLALGGWFVIKHGVRVAATKQANLAASAEADALYHEETSAYRAWVADLADRPADAQIARWHVLDKFYLVSDFIKRVGLKRDQVIDHVVLTECAPFARRSRLQYGPPRYSAYMVRILLLTRKGVRYAKLRLDANTGEAQNEERLMFRYDAVVSAKVTEKGSRTTAVNALENGDVENLRSRDLRLVLTNGDPIEMKANSFMSRQHPHDESESELIDAAYETSGIENALPTLEAIAAEGEEWLVHEQERREQWAREWDRVVVG
ncbi:hypothetical protein [Saccharothrix obliqua]|uniref:hypothetical protein n=1 Tax=Saccharothrix obliqua TaxID=2861747 RepID=UPI001C5F2483|nr:hypothetical protein [Saccharothrix obliqua]MBW4719987.1 hypothetical protein [Saccharothrix obliqua]